MFHFAPLSPTIREQRKQTMSPNLTIRLKLFISHALAVLLVSGSIGAFFYASALNSMQTGLKERLQSSAALISQTLDANTLRDVRCARDITCPGYINALGHLRTLQRMNSDIAFLYIMRQQGGRVFFVVDADETDKQAPPGKEYEKVPPTMMQGFIGLSVDQGITTDEWGGFLSGYAPLKNGMGEYLLGIDMRTDQVQDKFNNLRIAGLFSLLFSVMLALLLAKHLSSRFMSRISAAIVRCNDIACGKLSEKIIVHSNDEFDQLLLAINDMSGALTQAEGERQKAFDELNQAKKELEIRVTQRTADLKEVNNRLSEEIAQRMVAQNALQEAASTDYLTRLMNRRAILDRLGYEFLHNVRNQTVLTVLLLDLDHFKRVNDNHGHDAGDNVLIETAVRMKSMLRTPDMVARWGGEEFLIVLPNTPLDGALLAAEKIRSRIADTPFYINGQALRITASLGIAQSTHDCSTVSLLRLVDKALYAAKSRGRNRVEVAME